MRVWEPAAVSGRSVWTSAQRGRFNGLGEVPTVDADVAVRSAWLAMVLRLDVQKNLFRAREEGTAPLLKRRG